MHSCHRSLLAALAVLLLLLVPAAPTFAHHFGGGSTGQPPPDPPPPKPPRCPEPGCKAGCKPADGGPDEGPPGSPCPKESTTNGGGGGGGGGPGGTPCPNPDAGAGGAGDPVDTYTGGFRFARTDLVLNGVFPIEMLRRYDSQSQYDSPLGYGWAFGYDQRLYEFPDGSVSVRTRCGQVDTYLPTGGTMQIVDPERGRAAALRAETDGTYTLQYRGGDLSRFDVEGRLSELRDPTGNRLVMTYSTTKLPLLGVSTLAVDPTQPLAVAFVWQLRRIAEVLADGTVTGRAVTIEYDAVTGRVRAIQSSDGRRVEYGNEEGGTLGNRGNLARVTGLESIVETYRYQSPDPHNLTSLQDGEDTTALEFSYDSMDRVSQQVSGASIFRFAYTAPLTETTVTRTVVRTTGTATAQTTFRFGPNGFLSEKLDAVGNRFVYVRPAGSSRLDRIETYVFNAQTQAFDIARTVSFLYDSSGSIRERSVELTPGGDRLVERWEYEDDRVSAFETFLTSKPNDRFRTQFAFYRAPLTPSGPPLVPGNAGYGTTPILNLFEIRNVTGYNAQGVASSFETTRFVYDANGRLTRITPPAVGSDNLAQVNTYYGASDPQPGLLKESVLEVGGQTDPHLRRRFTYDAAGRVATLQDARSLAAQPPGGTTQFTWDALGRLRVRENELGQRRLFMYTGPNAGLADPSTAKPGRYLARIEDGQTGPVQTPVAGHIFQVRYDGRGQLVAEERRTAGGVLERFVTFTPDSDGNLTRIQDGVAQTLNVTYDLLNRPISVSDGVGNQTLFSYDPFGNAVQITDAKNRITRLSYDGRDRLIRNDQQTAGLVTLFDVDAAGRVIRVTDPRNQQTVYGFDLRARLISVTQPLGVATPADPDDFAVRYQYDARGRPTRRINARGQVQAYSYFPWGGLQKVEHYPTVAAANAGTPRDRTLSFTYDEAANTRSLFDTDLVTPAVAGTDSVVEPAGRLYTYTYDALERFATTRAHFVPGGTAGTGRLLQSSYDAFGNRKQLDLTGPGESLVQTWVFDAFDRMQGSCMPQSQPCAAGAETIRVTYRANDERQRVTHGNGTFTDYTYRNNGVFNAITLSTTASQLQQLVYTYDATLQIDAIREFQNGVERLRTGGLSPSFSYDQDNADRLTEGLYPSNVGLPDRDGYIYDAAGNRDDASTGGTALGTYQYDTNNRISRSPSRGYVFDQDGNLNQITNGASPPTSIATLTFDVANRLRSYATSTAPTTAANYTYDLLGRRIRKTVNGTTTWYLWDANRLLAEYNSSGARQVRYAYTDKDAPDQVAYAGSSTESIYDVHTDHLSTPRLLTDVNRIPRWRARPRAYGTFAIDANPDGDGNATNNAPAFNVRFPGQYFDAESQLHYNFRRYYDPDRGRYISQDPLGQRQVPNLYIYVENAPLSGTDPTGEGFIINNSGRDIRTSKNRDGGGQQIFIVRDGDTSGLFTDADTLIADDGTVIKIPDGQIVIVNDPNSQRTFNEQSVRELCPLSPLDLLRPELITPRLIEDPETEFGGPFINPDGTRFIFPR